MKTAIATTIEAIAIAMGDQNPLLVVVVVVRAVGAGGTVDRPVDVPVDPSVGVDVGVGVADLSVTSNFAVETWPWTAVAVIVYVPRGTCGTVNSMLCWVHPYGIVIDPMLVVPKLMLTGMSV